MRVRAWVGGVCLCAALAGCNTSGKKPSEGLGRAGPPGPNPPGVADRGRAAPADGPAPSGVGGLLAGQVVDAFDRPRPRTFVRVVPTPDPAQPAKGAPIVREAECDAHGYFTVQGLEPGRPYQLIARAPDGDRLLANVAWVTPPNPRVVIRLSEDYATSATPAVPPPPNWPDAKAKSPVAAGDHLAAGQGSSSLNDKAGPRGVEIGPPVGGGTPAAPAPVTPMPAGFVENAVAGRPPAANIGGAPGTPRPADPAVLPPPAADAPFCTVAGNRVENFALKDLGGQTWELRRHRQGKLLLLVFWHSDCPPCKQAIPVLNAWQASYGSAGLEVVGIAYEEGPLPERIRKINAAGRGARGNGFNYRILLGDVGTCPVHAKLQVQAHPTLILLDQNGQIVFRSEGLDPNLEQEIRGRLRVR